MATDKKKGKAQEEDRAKEQAKSQLESIRDMVKRLDSDDEEEREQAQQEIQEDPLSVEVRSGWYTPGEEHEPAEYMILLCTGGPACRIIGDLGSHNEPENARIEYQDWGTPWTRYNEDTQEDREAMLTYARQFYYGE